MLVLNIVAIALSALEIRDLSGFPFWGRVILTVALYAIVWVAIWIKPTDHTKESVGQVASSAGSNSPVIQTGDHSPVYYNQGISRDEIDARFDRLERLVKSIADEKAKQEPAAYPSGGVAFGISADDKIVPPREIGRQPFTANLQGARISTDGSNITIKIPFISWGSNRFTNVGFTVPKKVGAATKMIRMNNEILVLRVIKITDGGLVLALGLEPAI